MNKTKKEQREKMTKLAEKSILYKPYVIKKLYRLSTSKRKEIVGLANKFPYLNFVAWDVLLTDKGMCIIEANASSGINILQLWGGQKNKELGDLYRYYKLIK